MACSLARKGLAPAVPASESETGSMACSLARRDLAPAVPASESEDWQHGLQSGDRRGRGISRKESFQRRSILGLKNGYMEDQSWEEKHLRVKKLQMRGELQKNYLLKYKKINTRGWL